MIMSSIVLVPIPSLDDFVVSYYVCVVSCVVVLHKNGLLCVCVVCAQFMCGDAAQVDLLCAHDHDV